MGKQAKPTVRDGVLWVNGGKETAVTRSIFLESPQWNDWLTHHKQFTFKGDAGHFSARKENRQGSDYWYAYRRRNGRLRKAYLGKSDEMTLLRLEEAAANLSGQTILTQLSLTADSQGSSVNEFWTANTFFSTQAKIRPPTLPPTLVTRPRLTSQINTPVTFVSAPGGFGKSTLLNAWRQECKDMPVAWARLDADDDNLLGFWSTILMALRSVRPGFGQNLMPFLQIPSTITPSEIVARLTNELANIEAGSFFIGLVLDDFHHVKQSDVHTSMQTWLEQLPPGLQLIVAGRTRPPLALGRLRAMGLVTELDLNDLRFTLPEGIAFLQQHMAEEPLAYGDMESLVKRTGGWAAGLKLAILSINKQKDRRHVIDTFSGAHLYLREYFMETALKQQSTAVQAFLLKTSILKQLTGSLCDVVTGQTNSEQMLIRLWQENLFIIRSEEQAWYRYHDLFAEMLHSQLQMQFPDQISDLHRRAAAWYETQNMSADAVRHLLFIEDWEGAAEVIEDVGLRELAESGEDSRLLRWLQQLPETVVQRHKTLLFVYLRLAHLASHPVEVARFLQRIEINLTSKSATEITQDEQEILSEIRNIRRRKLAGDTAVIQTGVSDSRWHLLDALWILEVDHMPKTEEVGARLYEIYMQARAQGNLFVVLIAGADCANRAFLHGHLRQSEKIIYQILQQALTQRGKLPETASIALTTLSKVYLERNELNQADQVLQQAIAVDSNPTSSNILFTFAIIRAKLQSADGNYEAAKATIQAARTLKAQRPSSTWRDQDLAAYEAAICVRHGKWAEAERLLNESIDEARPALSQLVRAEILLQQNQAAAAEGILNRFVEQYPFGFPNEPSVGARVLLARALFVQHKLNQARQVFTETIRLTAGEGFIRPFLDYGTPLIPLIALTLHTKNLPAKSKTFIHQLLQSLGHTGDIENLLSEESLKTLAATASITQREQDVLHLVHGGLSNREIAAELCIAPSTVKTHLTNIYGKLDVNSRVQAVAEAQALKLI